MEKKIIQTAKSYFKYFQNKNLKELENLSQKAKGKNAILLTTEKDYFRINSNHKKNLSYLKISIDVQDKEKLIEEIKQII